MTWDFDNESYASVLRKSVRARGQGRCNSHRPWLFTLLKLQLEDIKFARAKTLEGSAYLNQAPTHEQLEF
jgi:hypothetical protein